MKWIQKIILLLFIGLISCKGNQEQQADQEKKSGDGIDKVKLADLKGQAIDMAQYDGKIVFINFWATWCKPCLQEMPSIQSAKEILKSEDIVFLFASDETVEQIEDFRTSHDYDFNFVKGENLEELNIMSLPTTFIFDKNRNLVFNEMGYKKWDEKINIDLILNIAKSK